MTPLEIAARVWPEGIESLEPLGGGITNRNFKVEAGGESFALRIGGNDTALLGIDRSVEHGASRAATALGLGPEVVAFLEPEGYLVTRFVEGETGEVGSVGPIEAAGLLQRLHEAAAIPGRFDVFAVVDAYAVTAESVGVPLPAAFARARALAGRIEERRGAVALCPCHNDLLAGNFIRGADRLWIVDWEYAGMGDPAFDLANFAVNNELDEAGDAALLQAYGDVEPEAHILMRYMSDFREAMWGVVQQGISSLDFDFEAYANDHFARLEATAAEARFRAALG